MVLTGFPLDPCILFAALEFVRDYGMSQLCSECFALPISFDLFNNPRRELSSSSSFLCIN